MFLPQIFGTNIRIEFEMLCFHTSYKYVSNPQNVWHEYQDRIENVGFYTHPRNMFPPPNAWHEYQDRIENVFFLHISQKYVSTHQMFGTNMRIELKVLGFMIDGTFA